MTAKKNCVMLFIINSQFKLKIVFMKSAIYSHSAGLLFPAFPSTRSCLLCQLLLTISMFCIFCAINCFLVCIQHQLSACPGWGIPPLLLTLRSVWDPCNKAHQQWDLCNKAHQQWDPCNKAHQQWDPCNKAHQQWDLYTKAHQQLDMCNKVHQQWNTADIQLANLWVFTLSLLRLDK